MTAGRESVDPVFDVVTSFTSTLSRERSDAMRLRLITFSMCILGCSLLPLDPLPSPYYPGRTALC
jgi:hypothetical protein